MNKTMLKIKTISLLLALTISTTALTGCNKKEPVNEDTTVPSSVSEISTTAEAGTENVSSTNETTKVANVTTKASKKTAKKKAGSPSKLGNAGSTKDLAKVDPEKAAKESYGTDVDVKETDTKTIDPDEFSYLKYENFSSHIEGVWKKFQATDKVKIDAQYLNEYLNYISLHLKDNFFAINCNGYDASYAYDTSEKYVYLNMKWIYYVDSSKYSTALSKANSIAGKATGSDAEKVKYVHDYIGSHTKYKANVDGVYNCLVNGTADCDGYTAAFMLCMNKLGIPCKAFTTDTHIFNLVLVSGKWYVVDVTWDDQDELGIVTGQFLLRGISKYKSYDVLVNLPLASSDLSCSRKIVISDDKTFRKACDIKDSWTYKADNDGVTIHLYENGELIGNLTLS